MLLCLFEYILEMVDLIIIAKILVCRSLLHSQ